MITSRHTMWQFDVVLNEGKPMRRPLDLCMAEISLPHDYQLKVRRFFDTRLSPYEEDRMLISPEIGFDVELVGGSVPFPFRISAKLDDEYGRPVTLTSELSSDDPPALITVGNPLRLFTFNYDPINYVAKMKVILTVHMEKSISVLNHLDQISTLIESGQFADCKVVSRDGEEFACHKAILSLKSAVILTAFEVEHMSEAKTGRIQLDCDSDVVKLLLRHFYTGEMPVVPDEILMELYGVAHLYQIESLKTQLAEVIVSKMNEFVTIENVLNTFAFADRYGLKDLRRFCLHFPFNNQPEIINQSDWNVINARHLDLVVQMLLL